MTFTTLLAKHAEILQNLVQMYFPQASGDSPVKALDFTYGKGALWWNLIPPCQCCKKSHVQLTKCDARPTWEQYDEAKKALESSEIDKELRQKLQHFVNTIDSGKVLLERDVLKRSLFIDSYSDLGLHDVALFDPPYLIGRNSFDYSVKVATGGQLIPMQYQGPRSWGFEIAKYVQNQTLELFNERVRQVNLKAPTILNEKGLLFVKIMDVRHDGALIAHHSNIIRDLTHFEIVDLGVYVRQGATTWTIKGHLQSLHGYWMIFRKKPA